ncbi:MAG: glycosyltransferase family 2 protein [Erysipelotrichia bacterium]|nr:glycosyltransferase family 2 protein [Erysipelotrichia bacterium]
MFTLIMPAFNEEQNIFDSITSVLNQKYQNFELIVVDDGSLDNTSDIVKKLSETSTKIKFFQPGKIGKNAAFNLAAKASVGDWIYFMGADDILPDDALTIWSSHIDGMDPSKRIALCARMRVFSSNKKYDNLILPKNKKTQNWSGPLTLMSRGMLETVLPIPVDFPNEDTWWALCIRYFADSKIRTNDIIINYRIHDGNAISRNSNYESFNEKYHIRAIVRNEFLKRFEEILTEQQKEEIYEELKLENYRYNGQFFGIITKNKNGIKNKVRALFLSNYLLYKIKKKLDRYMLGH